MFISIQDLHDIVLKDQKSTTELQYDRIKAQL